MLLFDFLKYPTTRCSPEARAMGFLTSSLQKWDNLHILAMPKPDAEGEWKIAPALEADRKLDHVFRVRAWFDL